MLAREPCYSPLPDPALPNTKITVGLAISIALLKVRRIKLNVTATAVKAPGSMRYLLLYELMHRYWGFFP